MWNSPTMMGGYYLKALSKHIDVISAGPAFGDAKSDVDLQPGQPLMPLLQSLPEQPDVLMCFYSKPDLFPPDLHKIELPKAWYVYDTHLHFAELSATAYLFDLVICSDEPTRERMSKAGHAFTKSLGFAADMEFYHRKHDPDRKRLYQVGFAGSVYGHPQLRGRQEMLERLQKKYQVRIEHRTLMGAAVADFFQDCQVVINHALNDDLNMRVPETLLSGRPLLTPMVTGLELQYQPDEHLKTFTDDNLETQLDYLLNNPEEAEKMALRGQSWTKEQHTYDHRAKQLITYFEELIQKFKANELSTKNDLLKQFAQFNYHRFRYPGDAFTWLEQHWTPKNAPEKVLKKILKIYIRILYLISKTTKKIYFQSMNRD